jgi:hypothetical protein
MEISQAQKDVRSTFQGGFAGQLVSAVLWTTSAATCTWHSLHLAGMILVLGGFFIFPLTQLLLRSMGNPHALPKGHPMNVARHTGFLHVAAHATDSDWRCGPSTYLVLSGVHDRFGSTLPAVCIHARNAGVCSAVRNSCHEWCGDRHVSANAAQPRSLAHSSGPLRIRVCRPKRGATQHGLTVEFRHDSSPTPVWSRGVDLL